MEIKQKLAHTTESLGGISAQMFFHHLGPTRMEVNEFRHIIDTNYNKAHNQLK